MHSDLYITNYFLGLLCAFLGAINSIALWVHLPIPASSILITLYMLQPDTYRRIKDTHLRLLIYYSCASTLNWLQ